MHPVLRLADNLSTALQKKSLSAAEGQHMAADVYYNTVDSIIADIKDQYEHLEQLLLKGASGSDFTAEKDAVTIIKEECDGLNLNNFGKDFADATQHRMDVFGKFC